MKQKGKAERGYCEISYFNKLRLKLKRKGWKTFEEFEGF